MSRWIGGLVQGRLPPLPPVLVGLFVTCVLTALGLGNLPGILVLTPVEAMLLAALGACHPHDGRLDWLVPALLQAGECVFLAALGFSRRVPAALVFALLAAVIMRHLDAGLPGQVRAAASRPTGSASAGTGGCCWPASPRWPASCRSRTPRFRGIFGCFSAGTSSADGCIPRGDEPVDRDGPRGRRRPAAAA